MGDEFHWFMLYGHESVCTADGFRVRVWVYGAEQPPVDGEGRTFAEAVRAAQSRVQSDMGTVDLFATPAPDATEARGDG